MVDASPQNQDGSRRFNCLIEGESIVFTVTMRQDLMVGELKKEIQIERALHTLRGIGHHTLELCKVDIDLKTHNKHSRSNIRLGDVEELESWKTISYYWPDQPPNDHLHIIVKAPVVSPERLFKRPRLDNSPPHTPPPKIQPGAVEAKYSPPYLDRQQTEIKMANALAGFEKYIECLATGELDGYLDSIRPEDKLGEIGVVLPRNPILLLHDLGKYPDQERIKELFKPRRDGICTITHLFSVSGSGKTRLSLDGLCSHWGLYISCKTEIGASGSNDFAVATEMLKSMSTWGTKSPDLSNNCATARRAFAMLLCARVYILKQLVKHFPAEINITDARRRWVLAQVLPPCLDGDDLFVTVLRALRHADTDIMLRMVRDLLGDIMTKRTNLFPEGMSTPLFVVIDEAQVAAEYLNFFPSTTGNGQRPILRGMVRFFQSSCIFNKIILSGTGLSMEMVEDVRGASSAKYAPSRVQEVFSNVGCFTREGSSQENYIRRYLNLSDNVISDRRLLERMKYWFSGRYRLTASLIEIFLHSENVPRHRVLTSFAERLTGFKITDAIELEAGEPHISPDLDRKIKSYQPLTELGRLFKEGLSNRMQLINCLTDALMRWTLGSELTSISIENNMQEMIALSVGFLTKMPSILEDDVNVPVYISEPLVVLSLRSIFETQKWTTMKEQMTRSFRNAVNPQTLGYVLEMALPLVLMETFGGKFSPLEETFDCGSKSLGSRRVSLVSLKRVTSGELQTCPVSWNEGSSDHLGLKANTPTHVLEFFDNPDGKIFLFPDNHRLWFFQDEETKELILCFDQSNDLEVTSKMVLGEDGDAQEVVHSYLTRLQSKTNPQSPSTSRKTPRFLRIVSSADDDQKQRLDGKDDLVLLRWDKVKEYIGSTADSVVKSVVH